MRSPHHHHVHSPTPTSLTPKEKKNKYTFFASAGANAGAETTTTSTTAATIATSNTTATVGTNASIGTTPSFDGKIAFDTMQQQLKTLLRPLVLRDHSTSLSALWSNAGRDNDPEEVMDEVEGGDGVDDNDSEVSFDEDDLVRVVKTPPMLSSRSHRPLSYRHGPFDNWATTTTTSQASIVTKKPSNRVIKSSAIAVRPGRASGPGLASGHKPAQGQGLSLTMYNTTTKPSPVSSTGVHASTSPHRISHVGNGMRLTEGMDSSVNVDVGVGVGVGVGVVQHGRDGVDTGGGLMDSRQRMWEKRVRTLVDRRFVGMLWLLIDICYG